MSLVNFVVIGYLLWKNVLPFADLMALGAAGGVGRRAGAGARPRRAVLRHVDVRDPGAPRREPARSPSRCGSRPAIGSRSGGSADDDDAPAPPPLVEAVDESLEDLRAEPDARRAIIRCYARFERAAAAAGLQRARAADADGVHARRAVAPARAARRRARAHRAVRAGAVQRSAPGRRGARPRARCARRHQGGDRRGGESMPRV